MSYEQREDGGCQLWTEGGAAAGGWRPRVGWAGPLGACGKGDDRSCSVRKRSCSQRE